MKFTITIDTENAAFDQYPEVELSRILRELADKYSPEGLESLGVDIVGHNIRDINGNIVGRVTLK